MSDSIIPGERRITADEMKRIRDLRESGRSLPDIALIIGNLAPNHGDAVNRLAKLLSPPRFSTARPSPRRRR